MNPDLLHLITTIIVGIIFPAYAAITGKSTKRLLMNDPDKKSSVYIETGAWLLGLCALVLATMIINQRDLGDIGLSFIKTPIPTSLLILSCIGVLFLLLRMEIPLSRVATLREEMTGLQYLMPTTPSELRLTHIVSFISGFCEEVIYRGFLFWQLNIYLPIIPAILTVNVIFALAHIGITAKNTVMTFLLGILWSITFYLTGSLWLAIFLHVVVDLYGTILAFKVYNEP